MFQSPRYIQNKFTVIFPREPMVRRNAFAFEERLQDEYSQAQILPVPDELDAEIPRILFSSRRGFSQISISQINVSLNVSYSPDWQTDIQRGTEHLEERTPILFDLLQLLETTPAFCGLTTKVRVEANVEDREILQHLANRLLGQQDVSGLHELRLKRSTVVEQHFFSNITISNYRIWAAHQSGDSIPRLASDAVRVRGIEIVSDYNDRYAFNERTDYSTSEEMASTIIEKALAAVQEVVAQITE